MDKLRIYWPIEEVLFRGKGIGEAWRDEFLRVAPYELANNWHEADVAFFYSDSVLDKEIIGNIPTVANHWGFYHERFLNTNFKQWARERMSLYKDCTYTICPSLVTLYQTMQFGVKAYFLPAGVDTHTLERYPQAHRRKRQLLFLSRIVPHKHLETLIQAASMLEPQVPIVVSGPGDTSEYKKLAEDLKVPITFNEFTDEQKVWALSESSILVHPSEYEGFSLPPLEALFYGTPVLALDIPQHRHLLKEFAVYFDNPENLAKAIAQTLEQYDKAREFASYGQAMVRSYYTLTRASKELDCFLHEAIREFLGKKVREEPELAHYWYDKDHRRDWVYKSQYAEEAWFKHWRLKKVLENVVGKSVLDVGAASGVYTVALAKAGYDVTWFDHSAEALENFKRNCKKFNVKTHMKLGNALSLPFSTSEFDTVWLGEILEHIEDPAKAFTEAIRVAKRRVIASTPIEHAHHDPMHLQHWTRESLSGLLQGYNATVEEVQGEGEEGCYFIVVQKQ